MSSEYKRCVAGGWIPRNRKGTQGNGTNTTPKMFLFQNVSLFTCSFLQSISYSFKKCLLSIYSEPRTVPDPGRSNLKATCLQRQGFLPGMSCPRCYSGRSSWIPQFSLDIQQNSVYLNLKAQTYLLGCSFHCQHLRYCVKALIRFKCNLLIGYKSLSYLKEAVHGLQKIFLSHLKKVSEMIKLTARDKHQEAPAKLLKCSECIFFAARAGY